MLSPAAKTTRNALGGTQEENENCSTNKLSDPLTNLSTPASSPNTTTNTATTHTTNTTFYKKRMSINEHKNLVSKLHPSTLADIEGLDPDANGFCRACDGMDVKQTTPIMGSFESVKRHVFVGSHIPPTEWDKLANNVVGLSEISKACKPIEQSRVTAFYDPLLKEGEVRRLMFDWKKDSAEITEVVGVDPKATEFAVAEEDPIRKVVDSEKIFVFVCAHVKRDGRCGYCGPAIIDLMRQDIKSKGAEDKIFVYGCSHVGGHAYAGNVLVYGKNGGIVYGHFCPSDVETLVNHLVAEGHSTKAPKEFELKVRGFLGSGPEATAAAALLEEQKKKAAAAAADAPKL